MIKNKDAAFKWWRDLQPDPTGKPDQKAEGRAALARLRRCATVAEAMNEPATISLFRRCGADEADDLVSVALTAAVLAHVRKDFPSQTVARHLGPEATEATEKALSDSAEVAILKPLRFQRVMSAATPDDRLIAMRRLVALADRTLNVRDLAEALLDWSEERRRRWTYEYWGVGLPATMAPTPAPEKDPTP